MVKEIALEQGTQEWLNYRKSHVTATDIAPIMGVSPWDKTGYTLFFDKTEVGEVTPTTPNEYMEWGTLLEPVIIDKLVRELGLVNLVRGRCYEDGWRMASLDGEADTVDGEHIIIEAKTTSSYDEWVDDNGNECVPLHYKLQAMWQMVVTGYRKVVFTVLMYGHKWWHRVVEWDEEVANDIITSAAYFHECVERDEVPAFIPQKYSVAAEAERKLRMAKKEEETKSTPVAEEVYLELASASESHREAEVRFKNAQNLMLEQMGDCKVAEVNGSVVAKIVKSGRGYTLKLVK